ncbi:MAG: electron transfer flavoprotein subunit alpha/FixB family protein [Selenomonadaceae bacterium]
MSEIVVFAPITGQGVLPSTAEVVTAARDICGAGDRVIVVAADDDVARYRDALSFEGVDELVLIRTPDITGANTDALSHAIADALEDRDVSFVLAPASDAARSVMARVAVLMDAGMTAAVKTLEVAGDGDIAQLKTSFGDQAMVSCSLTTRPGIVTLLPGNYDAAPLSASGAPSVTERVADGLVSAVEVLADDGGAGTSDDEVLPITAADYVVCVGRGAMMGDNFELAKKYAAKAGAALAGSRPMIDNGWLPFAAQVGESGTVIRPRVALILGVSGAIQFTEGIKGEPLTIAVNTDKDAGISHFAKYLAVADMGDVLKELLSDV